MKNFVLLDMFSDFMCVAIRETYVKYGLASNPEPYQKVRL